MLIDKKNSKDLVIPFTRCDDSKSIKILSLHYHELIGKIKELMNEKYLKYLIVDDFMLEKY